MHCTLRTKYCIQFTALYALHTTHYKQHTTHYTRHNTQVTLHTTYGTRHTTHGTLYNTYYTLHTTNWIDSPVNVELASDLWVFTESHDRASRLGGRNLK